MTQRARTRIQRLKDEEAALSYRFARHLAESQEEDSLGLRNGENRQPCHDPGGEERNDDPVSQVPVHQASR